MPLSNVGKDPKKLSCYNSAPPDNIIQAGFKLKTIESGTEAVSDPVQFNVNQPVAAGAIYVDQNNDGICEIDVSDLSGNIKVKIAEVGVINDSPGAVSVSWHVDNKDKTVKWWVAMEDYAKVSVNLQFWIRYK